MKGFIVFVLLVYWPAFAKARLTLSTTHNEVKPGLTRSLTLTCKAKPDANLAVITSLTLSVIPGVAPIPPTSPHTAQPTRAATTAHTTGTTIIQFNPFIVQVHPSGNTQTVRPPTTTTTTTTTTTPQPTTTTSTTTPPPQEQTLARVISNIGVILRPRYGNVTGHIKAGRSDESILELTINSPSELNTGLYSCLATGYSASTFLPANASATSHVALHKVTPIDNLKVMSKLEGDLNKMTNRWNQVDSNTIFHQSPVSYKGSEYILSQRHISNVNLGQFLCSVRGGYLVEISDRAEFEFVKKFVLMHINEDYPDVFLGATDFGHKGRWTSFTNTRVPFLQWGGYPSEGYDCVVFSPTRNDFNTAECNRPNRFMCEVPM